jgi:DNA-binding NarL/FixJ family response regulator
MTEALSLRELRSGADCQGKDLNGVVRMSEKSKPNPLKALVVDSDALVRTGLRGVLEDEGFEVVAASSGEEALCRNRSFAADVVVLGTNLSGMRAVEATRRLVEAMPKTSVLVLAVAADRTRVLEILRAGGSGYILKDAGLEHIVAGVRAVAAGHAAIDPRAAGALVAEVRDSVRRAPRPPATVELTERECALLELVACGLANVEIGRCLHLSSSSVSSQLSRLFEKVGVENRVQAAAYAIRHGVTSDASRAAA